MRENMTPEGAVDDAAIDEMAAILGDMPLENTQEPVEAEGQEVEDAAEQAADETDVVEGNEPEEVETEEDNGKEEEDSEELENYSLETIAEAWDMDPKEVGNLITGKQKVNGKWVEVTFNEALENFSRQSDYTAKTQALVDRTAEIEKQTGERFEKLDQMHNVMAQILQEDMQQLEQERQAVNWQELKAIDPADYAAKAMEFQQREQQLNQRVQTGVQQWESMQMQRKELQEQKLREQTQNGLEVMARDVPEWSNDETRALEQQGIADLLMSEGYTPEEMKLLVDPRAMKVARKAMLYDKLQAETPKPAPRKKVKILKPGAKRTNLSSDQSKYMNAMKRANKLGTDDAYAEALAVKLKL